MRHLWIGPIVLLMLTSCWPSVSEEVLDSFSAVNDSLEAHIDHTDSIRAKGLADLSCPDLRSSSDSLQRTMRRAEASIDEMKLQLVAATNEPGDYQVADSLFDMNDAGRTLHRDLRAAFDVALACCTDTASVRVIRSFWYDRTAGTDVEEWRLRNFYHVPRVAVITILSKTRHELGGAEMIAQDELIKQCAMRR